MTSETKKDGADCRMCGKCCSMEIPVTLLDIHRLAEFRKEEYRGTFESATEDKVSSLTSLFMIRKDEGGRCLFLSKEKGCTIHSVKPNICRFYSCALDRKQGVMSWTAACRMPSQRARLWEQSVAVAVTKAYLKKNGPVWNETDFRAALGEIFKNTLVRESQKLKLARDTSGRPMAMIYDCSQCEKRDAWAPETPVTLDDIRRISNYLGVTIKHFFSSHIASKLSSDTGCFKLKRNGRCIFFDPEKHCRVKAARPIHCRFTPCPRRTITPEMMDGFYLGSGTVEEQFRHQVAMAVTREYAKAWGTVYSHRDFFRALARIDSLVENGFELTTFRKKIAGYRYVDDAQSR